MSAVVGAWLMSIWQRLTEAQPVSLMLCLVLKLHESRSTREHRLYSQSPSHCTVTFVSLLAHVHLLVASCDPQAGFFRQNIFMASAEPWMSRQDKQRIIYNSVCVCVRFGWLRIFMNFLYHSRIGQSNMTNSFWVIKSGKRIFLETISEIHFILSFSEKGKALQRIRNLLGGGQLWNQPITTQLILDRTRS